MKQLTAWMLGLGLLSTACGDTPDPVEGSSDGSGTEGSTGTTMTPTTMTPTTDAMTSDATTTGPGEGSTTASVDSSGTEGGSSGTEGTEGSSSGGPENPAYPPCMPDADPVCPEPYDHCYEYFPEGFSACSQMCRGDEDCPQPASGDAPAVCAGINGDECVLDCANDATCPDGMECVEIPGSPFLRCGWPDA